MEDDHAHRCAGVPVTERPTSENSVNAKFTDISPCPRGQGVTGGLLSRPTPRQPTPIATTAGVGSLP
jgi:hypothetical protein